MSASKSCAAVRGTQETPGDPSVRLNIRAESGFVARRSHSTSDTASLGARLDVEIGAAVSHPGSAAAIVSAVLYWVCWVDLLLFYQPLGVSPTDIGIGPGEVLGISLAGFVVQGLALTLNTVALATIFTVAGYALRGLYRRIIGPQKVIPSQVADVSLLLLFGAILLLWDFRANQDNVPLAWGLAVVVIVSIVFTVLALDGIVTRHPRRSIAIATAVLVAGTAATTTAVAVSNRIAMQADPAQAPQYTILGVLATPWTPRIAWLTWTDSAPSQLRGAHGRCVIYLGQANGNVVVYAIPPHNHEVLSIPANEVAMQVDPTTVRGCPESLVFVPPATLT